MEKTTADILLKYEIKTIDGVKYLCIPLEKVLNDTIEIKETPVSGLFITTEEPTNALSISSTIKNTYISEEKMLTDVTDYLNTVAHCWQFKNAPLSSTVLKKVAGNRPCLNTIMYSRYGSKCDEYLTELINNNMWYIHEIWKNEDDN